VPAPDRTDRIQSDAHLDETTFGSRLALTSNLEKNPLVSPSRVTLRSFLAEPRYSLDVIRTEGQA
jgi:hypothetical protein